MLAEAIITSTIVLTTLVGLYANFMKIYKVYRVRETYYDIDGVYAIENTIDWLISNNELVSIVPDNNINYRLLVGNSCPIKQEFCNLLTKSYKVKNMYIMSFKKQAIESLIADVDNKTFKDYLNFVLKYYNFNTDEDDNYSYLFVVEYQKNDNDVRYYYSSLGLR